MTSSSLTCIIPSYNRSGYVQNCLARLQRCRVSNLEIIVADDGSTDNTQEVVKQVAPHAKYNWQPNTGTPSTARNAGFALSTGKYVAFLDCDDAWLPDVPKRALELLESYPEVEVLFADARMGNDKEGFVPWIQSGGQEAFFALPHRELEPGFRLLERKPFFRRIVVRNPVFIGSVIMRREAFAKSGGFNPKLRGAADWELWLRLATQYNFAYFDQPMAIYTRHLDNMSSDMDHMSKEFCQALANTLHLPHIDNDDRALVRRQLKHHRFGYAYMAYDRGDTVTARQRFSEAIQQGDFHPRTLALAASCYLPKWLNHRLRKLKQATLP